MTSLLLIGRAGSDNIPMGQIDPIRPPTGPGAKPLLDLAWLGQRPADGAGERWPFRSAARPRAARPHRHPPDGACEALAPIHLLIRPSPGGSAAPPPRGRGLRALASLVGACERWRPYICPAIRQYRSSARPRAARPHHRPEDGGLASVGICGRGLRGGAPWSGLTGVGAGCERRRPADAAASPGPRFGVQSSSAAFRPPNDNLMDHTMNPRNRLLAAIRGHPIDRVPLILEGFHYAPAERVEDPTSWKSSTGSPSTCTCSSRAPLPSTATWSRRRGSCARSIDGNEMARPS